MKIILYLLLFILCSCEHAPAADEGYRVMVAYSKEVYKNNKWNMVGIGGGFDPEQVRSLRLDFFIFGENLSVEESRNLIVDEIKNFLEKINQDKKINIYLSHRPFTIDDIHLGLVFYTKDFEYIDNSNYVTQVDLIDGKIFYAIYDKESKNKRRSIHSETYEEALKLINEKW